MTTSKSAREEETQELHASAVQTARTLTMDPEVAARGAVSPPAEAVDLPARYRDLGMIAGGGFGEVRRVHDLELDRAVAMKILRGDLSSAKAEVRFLAEAKLTAGLAHPGIVAVHDWGRLANGRLWFTMREVRGRTLGAVIHEVHAAIDDAPAAGPARPGSAAPEWTFRRLIDAFARACQAVAYAHRLGVVHRDLKPDNIMVGELGEVLVMDWGLGRLLAGPPDESLDVPSSRDEARLTQHGDVLGTPAYMPPEQARGARELHGFPSDVYSLGAILYHVLAGGPPYRGSSALQVLRQVLASPPLPVRDAAPGRPIPPELAEICDRAMRWEISERYADAEALAREVVAWLDGARRREQALAVVTRARALEPEIAEKHATAARLRAEAQALLDGVRSFEPAEKKAAGWGLEDQAEALEVGAAIREAEWLEALQGALTIDPELPEAHAALADHSKERLLEAERTHRHADAARFEASLRAHDRGRYAALLRGEGALTLHTNPPGARVQIERYELRGRRLVPVPAGELGVTPLVSVPLSRGSYRLRIRAPGRAEVLYPVLIERGDHWDGRAPGEADPCPIHLPREGELGPDDVYVPAGWCFTGGDVESMESFPLRRVWVDAFALRRFSVTNAEYLLFLNQLVREGRGAEAEACCPRAHMGMPQGAGKPVFARSAGGRYELSAMVGDSSGRTWQPDWPVVLIDWRSAESYSAWVADRAGVPLRLPHELEREKAARGADGRHYPWGNHFDATWACVLDSHAGDPARAGVGDYPLDESPYGARGLAGNVRDWCGNVWTREGPELKDGRLVVVSARTASDELRAVRGGAWTSQPALSRSAVRFAGRPGMRWTTTGLRLARSMRPA